MFSFSFSTKKKNSILLFLNFSISAFLSLYFVSISYPFLHSGFWSFHKLYQKLIFVNLLMLLLLNFYPTFSSSIEPSMIVSMYWHFYTVRLELLLIQPVYGAVSNNVLKIHYYSNLLLIRLPAIFIFFSLYKFANFW